MSYENIYEVKCRCGLRFSSKKYYREHLRDVRNARKILNTFHGLKEIKRLK